MKYDPKKSIYQDQRKLPPEWYSKIETFISNNWKIIFMIAWLLFCLIGAFTSDPPDHPWDDR